jgi:hypothetical protein
MKMAFNDWNITKWKSGIICSGKGDYNNGRKYQNIDIYLYYKGWFRNAINNFVIKINNKHDHTKDLFYFFTDKKKAMIFLKKYINDN